MLFQLGICNVIFLYTFICYYYIKVILDLKHILHWKQPFQIWQNLLQITLWVLIKVNLSQKKHFVHKKKKKNTVAKFPPSPCYLLGSILFSQQRKTVHRSHIDKFQGKYIVFWKQCMHLLSRCVVATTNFTEVTEHVLCESLSHTSHNHMFPNEIAWSFLVCTKIQSIVDV